MTTTETEYTVVSCLHHGTKVTLDHASARAYVEVARACADDLWSDDHALWHFQEGTSCWVDGECCVVDPYGIFD